MGTGGSMPSIHRLLGLGAAGLLVALLGGTSGAGEPADGVGCPTTISGVFTTDRPRIQRGKVLGLQFQLDRITDWGDAEEIHVGFKFPASDEHEDHRRGLKAFKKPTTQAQAKEKAPGRGRTQAKAQQSRGKKPVKAMAGGGEEEEHAPFLFRNSNVKPKLVPKQANRAHFEPHDGLLEWHLEKDMTYSAPAYRFLAFGKVEKEWELDHMDFSFFVHNATGFTCYEQEIEVPVF